MLIVVSSAKTQAVTAFSDLPTRQPQLLEEARKLVERCRELDRDQIAILMKISNTLAETTWQRFRDFSAPHEPASAGPALTTFQGEVFSQIQTADYRQEDFLFASRHLRILSGLYGVLGPLDLMQPYRLEMGLKLSVGEAANLYQYWSEKITDQLNADLEQSGGRLLLNCASQEYSRTVLKDRLDGTMLDLVFKQRKDGSVKTIAIHAKRARGMFVNWFIEKRITNKAQLKDFNRAGYRFAPGLSDDHALVFVTELS